MPAYTCGYESIITCHIVSERKYANIGCQNALARKQLDRLWQINGKSNFAM